MTIWCAIGNPPHAIVQYNYLNCWKINWLWICMDMCAACSLSGRWNGMGRLISSFFFPCIFMYCILCHGTHMELCSSNALSHAHTHTLAPKREKSTMNHLFTQFQIFDQSTSHQHGKYQFKNQISIYRVQMILVSLALSLSPSFTLVWRYGDGENNK